jgi:hypothetical protein
MRRLTRASEEVEVADDGTARVNGENTLDGE